MGRKVTHPEGGRVMVKQSDQGDADINVIVRRARQAGMLPPMQGTPRYGDFTGNGSFHDVLNQVHEAQEQFMLLPAAVRQACQNDVGVFLEKVHTDEGLLELAKLGLAEVSVPETAKPQPTPAPAPEPAPEP